MRNFLFILFLLFSLSEYSLASEGLKRVLEYTIESDSLAPGVHKDSCLISGLVKANDGNVAQRASINTVGMKFKSFTNKNGVYRMMIAKQSIKLFCFKSQYNEIITDEIEFKSGHHIVINFKLLSNKFQLIMDKPVIYLYSDHELHANVKVEPNGEFLFTYPDYNAGWNVTIDSLGLLNVKNQSYPYLFWEAKTNNLKYEKVGQTILGEVVQKKNVVPFLERVLEEVGLNPKEKTDFITYWAPRMMKEDEYLIQFLFDERCDEQISKMSIFPKPDVVKRIYMLFQKAPTGLVSQPQKIETIQRKGFTVVEWGGTELPSNFNVIN